MANQSTKKTVRIVDATPTWQGILPTVIAVLTNPNAKLENLETIKVELHRMARAADQYNDTMTVLMAALPALNFLRLHLQPGADPASVEIINKFIDLLNEKVNK